MKICSGAVPASAESTIALPGTVAGTGPRETISSRLSGLVVVCSLTPRGIRRPTRRYERGTVRCTKAGTTLERPYRLRALSWDPTAAGPAVSQASTRSSADPFIVSSVIPILLERLRTCNENQGQQAAGAAA